MKTMDRATVLTSRLLVLSREKTIKGTVMEINGVIRGIKSLVLPLLGKGITVHIDLVDRRGLAKILIGSGMSRRNSLINAWLSKGSYR